MAEQSVKTPPVETADEFEPFDMDASFNTGPIPTHRDQRFPTIALKGRRADLVAGMLAGVAAAMSLVMIAFALNAASQTIVLLLVGGAGIAIAVRIGAGATEPANRALVSVVLTTIVALAASGIMRYSGIEAFRADPPGIQEFGRNIAAAWELHPQVAWASLGALITSVATSWLLRR